MSRVTITTATGSKRGLPAGLDVTRVVGLDTDGRFVVDDFGGRMLFGLTLCCNASDKGIEHGVVCRGCYSFDEVGAYYFVPDGAPADALPAGVDPIASVHVSRGTYGDSLEEFAADRDVDVTRTARDVTFVGAHDDIRSVIKSARIAP